MTLPAPIAAVVVVVAVASGPAAVASEAETIAGRTGLILGSAMACGVPDEQVVDLGQRVIAWARDAAKDAADLRRARAAHESAVMYGAARARRSGEGACASTLRSFRELEARVR